MSKQFIEYIRHPISGQSEIEPTQMDTLKFPLILNTAPFAPTIYYAYADCYNILYLKQDSQITNTHIVISDILGRIPTVEFSFAGEYLRGDTPNKPLTIGRYYVPNIAQMQPDEIQSAIQVGNTDILCNMPGSIWFSGAIQTDRDTGEKYQLGQKVGDIIDGVSPPSSDIHSPLFGRYRFEVTISGAVFWVSTASIGAILSSLDMELEKKSPFPILDLLPKYSEDDYTNYYDETDLDDYPTLRVGKAKRALDALPFIDSKTQNTADTTVRRTSQGTIAPGSCGYRLNITITQSEWSQSPNADGYYTVTKTINDQYLRTEFDRFNGSRKDATLQDVITSDSVVYLSLATSASESVAFEYHLMPNVTVANKSITFYITEKPEIGSSDIELTALVF